MDPTWEIRKLTPSQVKDLVVILESHELWKRLMCNIPKKLESHFSCDITSHNHPKYNSEHFRLIENASEKSTKPCTEILFDEWGTSGKIRPSLGHLLYLLTKAKLFRAADYVAETLLHQVRPDRPETGPEALIPLDITLMPILIQQESNGIEELLDRIDYPSTAVNIITNSQANKQNDPPVIPQIVITPNYEDYPHSPDFTLPVILRDRTINNSVSDMMKFSLNTTNSNSISTNSAESLMMESGENNEFNSSDSSNLNPAFSQLLNSCDNFHSANIPNLSVLNKSMDTVYSSENNTSEINTELLPNIEVLKSEISKNEHSSNFIPDFNVLRSDSTIATKSLTNSCNLCSDPTRSRPCTSPLPTLSLNTMLPHFNYSDLQIATNNFNKGKYTSMSQNGRLLGSGAFGHVFLATGLFDRLVAVKRLNLDNVEIVNIDDTVTKQFRNEVEVLSKYKHENLLSLLGYSCDGCTYCLMYEYIPGGALKDRLQVGVF